MVGAHVHVYVSLERDEDGYPPFDVEEVDAIDLGGGQFQVTAPPAFVYGLAPGDVVEAVTAIEDDRLWVVRVLSSSDVWVARLMPRNGTDATEILREFTQLGCEPLATAYGVVAIAVPASADAGRVLDRLRRGQDREGSWYFDLGVAPPNLPME